MLKLKMCIYIYTFLTLNYGIVCFRCTCGDMARSTEKAQNLLEDHSQQQC